MFFKLLRAQALELAKKQNPCPLLQQRAKYPQGETMKHYEVLLIIKPTLEETEVKARVDFIEGVITKNGGKITSWQDMGTRKLAYKIDKFERGVYKVCYFEAPTALIEELVRNIRINEDIIRFLVVKYETKREVAAWEKLSRGEKLNQIKKPEPRTPRAPKEEAKEENEE